MPSKAENGGPDPVSWAYDRPDGGRSFVWGGSDFHDNMHGVADYRRFLLNGIAWTAGLAVPQVLRASHIVAWAEEPAHRMNPSNGLLLSATYDAAFDQHLLTFDEAGRMVLSPSLKAHHGHEAFRETFGRFEGRALARPLRFPPSEALMARIGALWTAFSAVIRWAPTSSA